MRLKRSFFNRDTCIVARELLGTKIVRVFDDGLKIEAMITETEAYHGFEDKASHASRKKTERNKIMFDKPGMVYVYLIYGMHHCLNFVTMKKDFPAAVLVRSIALKTPNPNVQFPIKTQTKNSKNHNTSYILHNTKIRGPGRVTKYLGIDKSLYGEDLITSKKIWVETLETQNLASSNIVSSKRIGVDYAGECADWEWNYKIDPARSNLAG
uniref:Putative 3-methyladenine DNA glycosylase n=1 Tax=candidate division CPR3 bacterium TaxID=2268181 RepID=A0A7C4R4D8_UNCC3